MAYKEYKAPYSGGSGRIDFVLNISTLKTDIVKNKTTERAKIYMDVKDASSQYHNLYGTEVYLKIHDHEIKKSVNFDARTTGKKILIDEFDTDFEHDSAGKCEFGFEAHHYSGVDLGNAEITGTFVADTIPRKTTITSFTVSKRSETALTFNWETADTIDYLWYSTNNGSSWNGYNTSDETSGSFVVSGLSHNTTYNCKIRVRRKDSQLTTDSDKVSQTTYKVPTQSLNSKTENKIVMNWSCDSTVDYVWYSINNGSSWIGIWSGSATSGSYTITGLKAGTTYSVKTRIRRKDTQLASDSTTASIKTYSNVTQTYVSKTVNGISMSWSLDTQADHIWYSIDNGSTWKDVGTVDSTKGTYKITGLSPNTTYKIVTKARRKATQTLSQTSALSITTYQIATLTSAGGFIIGKDLTVQYSNPSGGTIALGIFEGDGSASLVGYRAVSGNQYTFKFTSTEINNFYNYVPNSLKGNVRVYIRTTSNGVNYLNYRAVTITVDSAINKPTFTNFTYEDTHPTMIKATGNNQILIKDNSNVKISVPVANKAVAKNGASIIKYRFVSGNTTREVAYSSTAEVSTKIDEITVPTIKVSAIDSRGLETTVTKTAPWKAYWKPIYDKEIVQREDGVGTTVFFDISGQYWNANFGAKDNRIQNARYRYKARTSTNSTEWSDWIVIMTSIARGSGRFSTNSDSFLPSSDNGSTPLVFTLGVQYDIQFQVVDEIGQGPIVEAVLNSGLSGIDIVQNPNGTYSVGINKIVDSSVALDINGSVWARVQSSPNDLILRAYREDTGADICLNAAPSGYQGVYSRNFGKWLIRLNPNGDIEIGNGPTTILNGDIMLPDGKGVIQGELPTFDGNLNAVDDTKTFYCTGASNTPTGQNGYCKTSIYAPTYKLQEYFNATENRSFARIMNGGTWEDWAEQVTVEQGSNSNGDYIKFSNGLMICLLDITVTNQAISSAYGSLFQGTRGWTFPMPFVRKPTVNCSCFKWGSGASWGTVSAISNTAATLRGIDVLSRATGTATIIQATAIGYWR